MQMKAGLTVARENTRGEEHSFRRRLPALSALCLMLVAATASAQDLLLDLTRASEIKSKSHCFGWGGGLGGSDHGPPPPVLPVALQIVTLNASTYKRGDGLAAELVLTNKANWSMLIPSNLNPDLVYADGCKPLVIKPGARVLFGDVSLRMEDKHGFWDALDGAFLYGVSDDPTTYLELGPGKTLRIRTAGKVQWYNMIIQSRKSNVALQLPLQVAVYAIFSLDDPAHTGYLPATSTNRFAIRLEK